MDKERCCNRCGVKITSAVGNRVKVVGKEDGQMWVLRHVRQFLSLTLYGFIRPEIEGYVELCDSCFAEMQLWLGIEPAETEKMADRDGLLQQGPPLH